MLRLGTLEMFDPVGVMQQWMSTVAGWLRCAFCGLKRRATMMQGRHSVENSRTRLLAERREKALHVGGNDRYELSYPAGKPIDLVAIKNAYPVDGEFEAQLSRWIGAEYPRDAP